VKYLTVFSDASWDNCGAAAYAFFARDSDVIEKRAYPIRHHVKQSAYAELYGMCCAILHAIDARSYVNRGTRTYCVACDGVLRNE
jgi:hypothetical protein